MKIVIIAKIFIFNSYQIFFNEKKNIAIFFKV